MTAQNSYDSDVVFQVPFVHRLRFTEDVFGRDQSVLLELLESSGVQPPKVQFWLDEHVANAQPELKSRIRAFVRNHADRVTMPGNIQICPGGEDVKNDI
ncbi:MAG: 3-dehydroquinate synthase, partial [Planctomycetaceae bacterium]|nr:3-dehydroquinate synthase [Planctomycetaceae bacterium]